MGKEIGENCISNGFNTDRNARYALRVYIVHFDRHHPPQLLLFITKKGFLGILFRFFTFLLICSYNFHCTGFQLPFPFPRRSILRNIYPCWFLFSNLFIQHIESKQRKHIYWVSQTYRKSVLHLLKYNANPYLADAVRFAVNLGTLSRFLAETVLPTLHVVRSPHVVSGPIIHHLGTNILTEEWYLDIFT